MKLHRTTGRPDWADLNSREYNFWQWLAVKSNSILTPGNIVTVIGLLIVLVGLGGILTHHYWVGFSSLIIGRAFDLIDGWVAEATQTKSPLGEIFDALADKIGTFLTVISFYFAQITPLWLLILIVTPHVIISFVVVSYRKLNRQIHPSRLGKISMAVAWVSLLGFVLVAALRTGSFSLLQIAVVSTAVLSSGLGFIAASGYITQKS